MAFILTNTENAIQYVEGCKITNAQLNNNFSAKLYIAILLICISPCRATTNPNQDWESETPLSNGEVSTFSLHIEIKGGNITGRYCAIYRNGKKIDCSTSEESNIFGKTYKGKSITVNFNSSFGAKSGIATITIENDNLIWRIKKHHKAVSFTHQTVQHYT